MKTLTPKDICTMRVAALLTIAKIRKQPNCPSLDEWVKKMACVYICVCRMEYSITKKNETFHFLWLNNIPFPHTHAIFFIYSSTDESPIGK